MKSTSELFSLKGKVALVTGGGKGIGQAIALRLADAGAVTVVSDLDQAAADQTVAMIKEKGGAGVAFFDDLATVDDATALVNAVVSTCHQLDILVNNAGIFRFQPFVHLTTEMWDQTFNVNLRGAAFLSQAAAKQMIAQGTGGRIINISSIDAFHPTGNLAHYDASKGGLEMLTKAMAKELAGFGILVNGIAPGGVATPGAAAMMGPMDPQAQAQLMEGFLETLPLKRMGNPDEIANVALFLASEASSYLAGTTIIADGGALIR